MAATANVQVVTTDRPLRAVVPVQAPRLLSVDVLRGLVMVIMALDHTRDFLSYARFAPEDVSLGAAPRCLVGARMRGGAPGPGLLT